jgi:hypothetical protein
MAIEIPLEPNEELVFSDSFQADSKTLPFAFAASDRNLFISKQKHFAKESWYFEKIPIEQIKQVFLRRERSLPLVLFSALLFISGLILAFIMMSNALNQELGTRVSGVPFAMIVCGLVMPFLAKGRKVLIIESANGIHKWKPRLVVDKKSRNRIKTFQTEILNVCEHLGLRILRDSSE